MEKMCHVVEKVLVDVQATIEFHLKWWDYGVHKNGKFVEGTMEDRAKCLEERCQDLKQFLKDHRSQDEVELTVERKYADQCSVCGREWEPDVEDGITCCAGCGAILEIMNEEPVRA